MTGGAHARVDRRGCEPPSSFRAGVPARSPRRRPSRCARSPAASGPTRARTGAAWPSPASSSSSTPRSRPRRSGSSRSSSTRSSSRATPAPSSGSARCSPPSRSRAGPSASPTTSSSTWISERFLLDLRGRFYAHLQRLPLDFFEGRRLGDVLSRLTGDIQAIESFVLSGVADALSYALRVAFFVAALFWLQWDLALVALIVAPALLRRRAADGEAAQARLAREAAPVGVDRGRRRGGPREHGARPGLRPRGDRGGALPASRTSRRSARR